MRQLQNTFLYLLEYFSINVQDSFERSKNYKHINQLCSPKQFFRSMLKCYFQKEFGTKLKY